MYIPDESGINSLGGFAYQIKVFVSYMLSMDEGMQAEFETEIGRASCRERV